MDIAELSASEDEPNWRMCIGRGVYELVPITPGSPLCRLRRMRQSATNEWIPASDFACEWDEATPWQDDHC